jgi:hypothetical protein
MALFKTNIFYRGSTIIFLTTFTDQNGNVVHPASAAVSVNFNTPQGQQSATIVMLPPGSVGGDPTQWYGSWDSRGANPGMVSWSIHSGDPTIPYVVADGTFQLNANPSNLITF